MFHLRQTKRLLYPVAAVSLIAATLVPSLSGARVSAAQVQSRTMQLSSSAANDTGVTYGVSFKTATTGSIQGYVIEFCDNSPIIGDTTCNAIPGFDVTSSGVSGQSTAGAGQDDLSTFTSVTALSSHTYELKAAAAVALTSGNTAFFNITNVHNPSTANHTFYARLYTYATAANADAYTLAGQGGTYVDAGGFALSTAQAVTVTAKVQEQLSFCVYTGANCGAGGSAIILGDTNGVLANYTTPYTDANTKFDLSTNAQTGAIVNAKLDTLKSGTNSIPAEGTTCTLDSTTNSTAYFGMRIASVASAPLEAVAPYNCVDNSHHTLDTANTTSTYGQTIADTTNLPLSSTTGTIEFAAKAALTTPAGVYTTTANFIATGTF